MNLSDVFELTEDARGPALAAWAEEMLRAARLTFRPPFDAPHGAVNGWFTDGPDTYFLLTSWTAAAADVAQVRPMVEKITRAQQPVMGVILSMSGFTVAARRLVDAEGGGRVLLFTDEDATSIEQDGIRTVLEQHRTAPAPDADPRSKDVRRPGALRSIWTALRAVAPNASPAFIATLTLISIGVTVLGIVVGLRTLRTDNAASAPPPTSPPGQPTFVFDLAPVSDRTRIVELRWTDTPGYTYVVEWWRPGHPTNPDHLPTTDAWARLPVDASEKYCFQVKAVSGDRTYGVSNLEPIRGALCRAPAASAA
ncbi:MAG TPA: hypothetical protein VGX28_13880 [Frankiaceae bacterium]|nr:hypothetical protein [Frankiaceae bacterium]